MIVHRSHVKVAELVWMKSVTIPACVWMDLRERTARLILMNVYRIHAKMALLVINTLIRIHADAHVASPESIVKQMMKIVPKAVA